MDPSVFDCVTFTVTLTKADVHYLRTLGAAMEKRSSVMEATGTCDVTVASTSAGALWALVKQLPR